MLNRLSDLVRLRTFAPTEISSAVRSDVKALTELVAGDVVRARVESTLEGGAFRVSIGPHTLTLRLPAQAQPGEALLLTVVAHAPQLKFALATPADTPAVAADISRTARFITALLGESEKLPLNAVSHAGSALPVNTADEAHVTPAALREVLSRSGMFYESHQAQWVAGGRELQSLMQEPQAQLQPLRAMDDTSRENGIHSARSAEAAVKDPLPRLPDLPVHRDALNIIKQQLDTLETRHIAWHGMIWNGQPLDWDVTELPRRAPEAPQETHWRTRLRLVLPRLGEVDATLQFDNRRVSIALGAADENSASVLAGACHDLQRALRKAGIVTAEVSVNRENDS